jgi:hypothetical protein
MPGYVTKGTILAKLDDVLNGGKCDEFYNRIKAKQGGAWKEKLLDVAVSLLGLTPQEAEHLEEHWFGTEYSWWPRHQPIDLVLRYGLIHAIDLAEGRIPPGPPAGPRRTLDCYWVCGIEDVNVISIVSKPIVTTLIVTPPPPVSDHLAFPSTGVESIFTTRHQRPVPGEVQVAEADFIELVQPRRAS